MASGCHYRYFSTDCHLFYFHKIQKKALLQKAQPVINRKTIYSYDLAIQRTDEDSADLFQTKEKKIGLKNESNKQFMPFFNKPDNKDISIYYEDHGSGKPVSLIHGWPLSHRAWEQQTWKIVKQGYRCISYDRRGFGLSSAPWDDYDYTTLASDLRDLIQHLDLNQVTIVGFSMGGGEVVRYFTEYDDDRIEKAALISSIIPLVAQKDDNPDGVPQKDLEGIIDALQDDRVGFLKNFHKNFYNFDDLSGDRISEAQLDYDFIIASHASPRATIQCALSWAETDFRNEIKNVSVPTLIVHGNADNIVPIETSADQAAEGIADNEYHIIDNAPHGLNLTHKDELNKLLINFIDK